MMRQVATETRAHYDLDQLEKMFIVAHRICVDGVDRRDPLHPELRDWFYSWSFIIERILGEVSAQKKKIR